MADEKISGAVFSKYEEELTAKTVEAMGAHGISEAAAQQTVRDIDLLNSTFGVISNGKTAHAVITVCLVNAWATVLQVCDGDKEAAKAWIVLAVEEMGK